MNTSSMLSILDESLLTRIVFFIYEDQNALCALCVVNKSFNSLASCALYSNVSMASRSDNQALCGFLKNEAEHSGCALNSSCLPRNAACVQAFEVTGLILPGPSQTDILHALEVILSKYANLRSFSWRPSYCDTDLTLAVAQLLPRLHGLERLSIKVPFVLPPVPTFPSPPKTAQSLDVIAEEDEEHEKGEQVESPAHEDRTVNRDKDDAESGVEDSPPYEYKPLEDDSDGNSRLNLSPPCFIPPRELNRIRCLILASPTPEVLVPLPDVLQALDRPIQSLYLEEDCGSVTPGILASLLPVAHALEHFGLGVAYSVKYDELFPFLDGLPKLRKLELYHYPQFYRPSSPLPRLCALESLKITHAHTTSRQHTVNMCVWIRRLICSARLSVLEIACENTEDCPHRGPGHGISHDGLVEHLVLRHKATLRVLRMPGAYLGTLAMKKLLGREGEGCKALEEVEMCVRKKVFDTIPDLLGSAPKLRKVRLTIVNVRKGTVLPVDEGVLQGGRTSLRTVIVNGRGHAGEWTTEIDDMQQAQLKLKAVFRISEIEEKNR